MERREVQSGLEKEHPRCFWIEIFFRDASRRIFSDTEEGREGASLANEIESPRFNYPNLIIRLAARSAGGFAERLRFSRIFLLALSLSLSLSFSRPKLRRGHEEGTMDKLARREPVTRGRYFYEPRGMRPKPARLHVSHVSPTDKERERGRDDG